MARQAVAARLGNPPIAIVLWDGQAIGHAAPVARVVVRDRPALVRLVLNPDLHFGDAYAAGRIEVEGDLLALLEAVYRVVAGLREAARRLAGAGRSAADGPTRWPARGPTSTTITTSATTSTSCGSTASWSTPAPISPRPRPRWKRPSRPRWTSSAASSGCGRARRWSRRAAAGARWPSTWPGTTASRVKAYNISHEQIEHARRRARAEGLDGRVEFIEDDYRNIAGRFDVFVSVGMLEHVGPDHYRELGGVIDRCLSPAGRGLIHSIGRDRPGRINPWIERRIFPGPIRPASARCWTCWSPGRSRCWTWRTCGCTTPRRSGTGWPASRRPPTRWPPCSTSAFVRAWRLYLAGSMAAFTTGTLQLFQVLFARHAVNAIPWTRQRLWEHGVRSYVR